MPDTEPLTALQTVIFHEPKIGAPESEWEDCAGHVDNCPDRPARLVVVDGATEAYDAVRWVGQLVESFVGPNGPATLQRDDLDRWFGQMQQTWVDERGEFGTIFEEHKFCESGSFATFLGCEVHGLGLAEPHWYGAALGDAVLFHVRAGRLVAQLPVLSADSFGINPKGVFTQASERVRMRDGLEFDDHALEVGDVLYLTTDAVAQWLLYGVAAGQDCWDALAAMDHPRSFRAWVGEQREAGMKNDDVTVLRAEVTGGGVDVLVLCR